MGFSRLNALNQALDIAGSFTIDSAKTLTDESGGLGAVIQSLTAATLTVSGATATTAVYSGLSGLTAESVGAFLTVSGMGAGNNGTFLIIKRNLAGTTATVSTTTAVNEGPIGPGPDWQERAPYNLQDDLNFERTDRAAIKGVAYDAAIPTYTRPTDTLTAVPADLSNIASKTTDARSFIVNRKAEDGYVSDGYSSVLLTGVGGTYDWADSTDETGVPVTSGTTLAATDAEAYTEIIDPATEAGLTVLYGPNEGNRIFGLADGVGSEGTQVTIVFWSVPLGDPLTSKVAYTWEVGQPTTLDFFYPYRERLDLLSDNAFRTTLTNGLVSDAGLSADIDDLNEIIGTVRGAESLVGLLTNLTDFFPFSDLDATPTVVEALNELNKEIGNRDYTGTILVDDETITASLQRLADAICASDVVRTIERLTAAINAGTSHLLPGSISYTLDPTNNGLNLWTYWRGVLRDPGPVMDGNDYEETDTTHITPYCRIKAGDHISYFILQ